MTARVCLAEVDHQPAWLPAELIGQVVWGDADADITLHYPNSRLSSTEHHWYLPARHWPAVTALALLHVRLDRDTVIALLDATHAAP